MEFCSSTQHLDSYLKDSINKIDTVQALVPCRYSSLEAACYQDSR